MRKRPSLLLPAIVGSLLGCGAANAGLIAGVDFEGATAAEFDRNPDDHDLADGISVSSGTSAPMFDGWTLLFLDGSNGANGNLRNDNGANTAGATTPNFPARLEGGRTGSWAITIPSDVVLDLDRIEFDVRGATGGTGRDGQFNTSLDAADTYLWEDLNLPGRTTGNWQRIIVDLSGAPYQDLTNQTVSFIWRTPAGAIDLDTIELYGTIGTGSQPFAITDIDYAPDADTVTLTWRSRANTLYRVVTSTDLSAWTNELVDSIGPPQDENPDDGDHITLTFDLAAEGLDNESDLFFRVEEQ